MNQIRIYRGQVLLRAKKGSNLNTGSFCKLDFTIVNYDNKSSVKYLVDVGTYLRQKLIDNSPPKTTEWMAPRRTVASMAMMASGMRGM